MSEAITIDKRNNGLVKSNVSDISQINSRKKYTEINT